MNAPSATTAALEPLTDQQRTVLEIERMTWAPSSFAPNVGVVGTKDRWMHGTGKGPFIREVLGISETRYAQILAGLLTNPAAELYDPQTIHRLQRLHGRRREQRQRDHATAARLRAEAR